MTASSAVNPRASSAPPVRNTVANISMSTLANPNEPNPIGRSNSFLPSPRARLIRILVAIDSPSGTMKVSAAQLSAI